MAIDGTKLDKWFGPKAVPGEEHPQVCDLRSDARKFADSVLRNTPPSADQSHAIRHIRDALQASAQAVMFESTDKVKKK